MTNELERIWKGEAVEYFKVLSQHSPTGTEENQEKLKEG
jgi:hypothetical protein